METMVQEDTASSDSVPPVYLFAVREMMKDAASESLALWPSPCALPSTSAEPSSALPLEPPPRCRPRLQSLAERMRALLLVVDLAFTGGVALRLVLRLLVVDLELRRPSLEM